MPDCLFCRILKKEIPSKPVFEDDKVYAFDDINPQAPVHLLVIPKRHITSMNELQEADRELTGDMFMAAKKLAKENGLDDKGYRTVICAGPDAVQHLHLHVIGGRKMGWPPG